MPQFHAKLEFEAESGMNEDIMEPFNLSVYPRIARHVDREF